MKKQNNTVIVLTQKFPRLPKGILNEVSRITGYNRNMVSMVKRGVRQNTEVLSALVYQLEKHTAQKADLAKRVKKL